MEDFFAEMKNDLGISLNAVQKKAVLQTDGPLLLLASPGSGKTTTIIMRIGYLIKQKGINPNRIKAVTFSKASANDMKDRFMRFYPDLQPADFSTIHSFAFEVVRNYYRGMGTSFRIIEGEQELGESAARDENIQLNKKLILRNLFKSTVGENITEDQMEELVTYISYVKNKMLPKDKWSTVSCDVPKAEQIIIQYEEFKRADRNQILLDFDDMLTVCNEVLGNNEKLLSLYQQRYDYILTDESQDTSLVQHSIIEKLVSIHKNLCVVADDDQSIYSWRGAEPSYLLEFKKVYPEAVILFMEQNYRSTQDIVNVSNQFIKRNKNRYEKNMFTENPPNKPIEIRKLINFNEQSKYLVKELKDEDDLKEIAILYRNNSSSIGLMNDFDRAGIAFYMKDADNRFFSHWVVQDILNFMRMAFTDKRPDILEKIHLKFNGYISKQQMSALKQLNTNDSVFDNLLKHVKLQDYQVKLLKASQETFKEMKEMKPLQAIRVIRDRLGYDKALEKICKSLGFRIDYLIGILDTLEEIAADLKSLEDFAKRLKHLEAVLKTAKRKKGQNAVTLSTFHSSKGLEFEKVYMIDLVHGIIPSSEDQTDSGLMEESARLFYVGMTRVKKQLKLITYGYRDGKKAEESLFVADVKNIINPPDLSASKEAITQKNIRIRREVGSSNREKINGVPYNPNAIREKEALRTGITVVHRVFGTGEITNVDEEYIHMKFPSKEKKLSIKACLDMGLLEPMIKEI
ncbi:ATP-dependent helicase [Fictibacillus sp. b24]|uniref:ATP-dependent helicase n=1 Tax=Fictibacillus sp. b24 TaxID=3055863 RepID=UPI0025A2D727|nr:ATP-dependent helicase [Fictibacillus sp. b24]MDM5317908.1 ATP-dependent helicase [Fictibacillus sp. b24]